MSNNISMVSRPNIIRPDSVSSGDPGFDHYMNNMTPEQLKEKYKNQIASIKEMGFDKEDDIIKALQKTNGNVDAAIERLVSELDKN